MLCQTLDYRYDQPRWVNGRLPRNAAHELDTVVPSIAFSAKFAMNGWAVSEETSCLLREPGSVSFAYLHAKATLIAVRYTGLRQTENALHARLLPRGCSKWVFVQKQPTLPGLKLVYLTHEFQVPEPGGQSLSVLRRVCVEKAKLSECLALG